MALCAGLKNQIKYISCPLHIVYSIYTKRNKKKGIIDLASLSGTTKIFSKKGAEGKSF